jgi:hypothetical protein
MRMRGPFCRRRLDRISLRFGSTPHPLGHTCRVKGFRIERPAVSPSRRQVHRGRRPSPRVAGFGPSFGRPGSSALVSSVVRPEIRTTAKSSARGVASIGACRPSASRHPRRRRSTPWPPAGRAGSMDRWEEIDTSPACPRQESNLVPDLRKVVCRPPHSEDSASPARESNPALRLRRPPCIRHTRRECPRQESNLVCDLRRVACGVRHTPRATIKPTAGFEPA